MKMTQVREPEHEHAFVCDGGGKQQAKQCARGLTKKTWVGSLRLVFLHRYNMLVFRFAIKRVMRRVLAANRKRRPPPATVFSTASGLHASYTHHKLVATYKEGCDTCESTQHTLLHTTTTTTPPPLP